MMMMMTIIKNKEDLCRTSPIGSVQFFNEAAAVLSPAEGRREEMGNKYIHRRN